MATTYYVSAATGSDSDTGLTEALAFITIQKALDTVANGDTVWVKADGTYNEALTISTIGLSTSVIRFEGYTTSIGDGGIPTNDGTTGTLTNGMTPLVDSNHYVWKNFRFTNFASIGFGKVSSDHLRAINIRVDNNGTVGIMMGNSCSFYGIYAHDNDTGMSVRGDCCIVNCIFSDNTVDGISIDDGTIIGCLIVGNGTNGINFFTNTNTAAVVNCTIDGTAKVTDVGILFNKLSATESVVCVNNIVYDCVLGISGGQAGVNLARLSFNNLVNGNTTPYSDFGTEDGEVTDAPAFVNEGTDYTPAVASPARATGADLSTLPWGLTITGLRRSIGALEAAAALGDYPAVADVEKGVTFDTASKTGTFLVPGVGDVEDGVQFGAGDTEFEGTFGIPDADEVESGVGFGADDTQFTGTLTASGGSNSPFLEL